MAISRNKSRVAVACLLLGAVTISVYLPVVHNDFINYDDPAYVTENPYINHGLTWDGLTWAFTRLHGEATYWHPLTWVSHMLDCELFGLKAAAHHLENVFLHAANAILLFLVLRAMTGAIWRSAVVAALFAWHPLQVDTVAWVAERKNVLSTLFWMLTLWAYVRYAQNLSRAESREPRAISRKTALDARPSTLDYGLALFFFALGLMCKPILVTLPFALLLLDYWPLRRVSSFKLQVSSSSILNPQRSGLSRLILEKLPFFALSAASGAITIIAHQRLGSIMEGAYGIPLDLRIKNAVVSYIRYIGSTLWPTDLAVCYPHPGVWPGLDVIVSLVTLMTVTGIVIWQTRRRPYLLVGWFWFMGTLVPTIGLIQAGVQAMADRFAYVPVIGLFILIVWGIGDFAAQVRLPKPVMPLAAGAALLGCIACTSLQLRYWKDSVTLFTHAIDVTENNFTAHTVLGLALSAKGKTNEAIAQFSEAIRINPLCADALNNLGVLLTRLGKTDEARPCLEKATRLKPQFAEVVGKLAVELASKGHIEEAITYYRDALRWKPDQADTCNNLAWLLATNPDAKFRDGAEAVRLAARACELTHYKTPILVGTLAAAYAEAGRFDEAVATGRKARALALAGGQEALAQKNARLLKFYRAKQPYHEAVEPNAEGTEASGAGKQAGP